MKALRLASLLFPLLAALPAGAQEMDLDRLLELNLDDLVRLEVVSAGRVPGTIDRVPATVRVVTAEEIAERGYFTLEEALADLPGIQFRNIQGFNSYVFVRGVPAQNNKILLLVDGIEINELNSGGFYGGGQFNLANVERIEVAYGPASALYGTNAVSGIVHVITRRPGEGREGRVDVAAGSFGTSLVDFRAGFGSAEDRFAISVAGMSKKTEKDDLGGSRGDHNWTEEIDNFEDSESIEGTIRWGEFSAGLLAQDKNSSRATVQASVGTPYLDHGTNWHIRFLNGWLAWASDRPGPWAFRSTAYYRSSAVRDDTVPLIEGETEDSPGRQFRWSRPGNLLGNETQATWTPSSRFSASGGFVVEREELAAEFSVSESGSADERPPRPPAPERLTHDLLSLFAEARVGLAGNLELFAGLRHDDSSSYGTVDTPRAGLVLQRGPFTGKLLYMEAFRAPRPWDFTDGLGNPALRPEESESLELSGSCLCNEHLRVEFSLYRGRVDGLLVRSSSAEGERWINGGTLDTEGLEAEVEFRKGPWKGWGNYSFTDSTDASGEQVPEIARHGANVGVAWTVRPYLTVGLRANYLGSRTNPKVIPATGDRRIDDALVLHATAQLRLPHGFDLLLVVGNLGDTAYFHPSNLPPSRYRQEGRGGRLQLGWSF